MRRFVVTTLSAALLSGCIEPDGPEFRSVGLQIVPEFGEFAAFTSHIDILAITVERGDSTKGFTTVVKDTVAIDAITGEASINLVLVLLKDPETFRVTLEAIRSSTGMVIFQGTSFVAVSAGTGGGGGTATIPITYSGPIASTVVLSPADTSAVQGSTYVIRATTLDGQGAAVDAPVTFRLVTPGDSVDATIERLTGRVRIGDNAPTRQVFFRGEVPTGASATARLFIGVTPGGLRVTPGFDNVGVGSTTQLTATLLDQFGQPISGTVTTTWASRNPGRATVNATGLVTAVSPGEAVIVGTGGGFSDSVVVNVAAAGDVPVSSMGTDRGFDVVSNGSTVTVTIMADMAFSGEALGSYNATFNWDPARFQYVSLSSGDFPAPTVNTSNAASGELRFAQANPTGASGQVVLARIALRALSVGTSEPTLTITELSGITPNFTNLINNVVVIQGDITVR